MTRGEQTEDLKMGRPASGDQQIGAAVWLRNMNVASALRWKRRVWQSKMVRDSTQRISSFGNPFGCRLNRHPVGCSAGGLHSTKLPKNLCLFPSALLRINMGYSIEAY
jgi:hypothetical protein